MKKKINVFIENGSRSEYAELERILQSSSFETERNDILNPDAMGFDFATLAVLLPAIYPYVVELRKTLSSYLSYKKTQIPEYKLTLENNGKKLHMEAKNMAVPDITEFKSFFEIEEQE